MLRGNRSPKSYKDSKMQKGQCFLPSHGVPPSWSQKRLQINNSIRKLLYKKTDVVFFFGGGSPNFLIYILLKTKYHSAWTGSMLRGVQRYDNDPDCLVYTFLKNEKHGAATGSMLRGIGVQKSYTESKTQKGQWFLPSRGVPPSWSQKMLQINNSIRKLLYKKRKLYFVFFLWCKKNRKIG